MAFVDLYEVKDVQSFGTVEILNVWHVEKVSPGFTAATILEAYEDTILTPLLPMQNDGLTHTILEARSLSDPLDFSTRVPSPNVGTRVGQSLSNFEAIGLRLNRERTDMDSGQKRFQIGDEGDLNGNLWQAPILALAATLGAAMVSQWETVAAPGTPVCDYVIIKRICKTSPSPPCVGGYRLPLSTDPLTLYRPLTFVVDTFVTSQVSRKRTA